MLIGILCIILVPVIFFIFCLLLRPNDYEREISDREQEEYLRNWEQRHSKHTKDIP